MSLSTSLKQAVFGKNLIVQQNLIFVGRKSIVRVNHVLADLFHGWPSIAPRGTISKIS